MAETAKVIQPLRKRASTEKQEQADKPGDSITLKLDGLAALGTLADALNGVAEGLQRQNELAEEQNKLLREQNVELVLANKIALAPVVPIRDNDDRIISAHKDLAAIKKPASEEGTNNE